MCTAFYFHHTTRYGEVGAEQEPDLVVVGPDGEEELPVDGERAADHDRGRGRLVRSAELGPRLDP